MSAACKLVTPSPHASAWQDFHAQVISAVGEAFNNVVLHAYAGRSDGPIEFRISTARSQIRIEMRDWGSSFDPCTVPAPDLDALPESGLGLFIMQSFMEIEYRPGRPNSLTLSKRFDGRRTRAQGTEGTT